MKALLLACLLLSTLVLGDDSRMNEDQPIAIVIHGGAGTIRRDRLSEDMEAAYRSALREAVLAGYAVLKSGGSASKAVTSAITIMEDSPLFNAGHGAVLNNLGGVELDASIMVGNDLSAGAVAGIQHVKNPILLAEEVRVASPHVMLMGAGAEEFAKSRGFGMVENTWFRTERRQQQLERAQGKIALSEDESDLFEGDKPLGTVGAVALDMSGVIAAGTSTGGMTNKRYGRIGDSPIIGAGTYADTNCGISATGHGEYFIRAAVAHDICARIAYLGISLADAAETVVNDRLVKMGADGGIIGLDADGNVVMPFNSSGMYRASVDRTGEVSVDIFR